MRPKYITSTSVVISLITLVKISFVLSFALPGKFDFTLDNNNNQFVIPNRGLYNQTEIQLQIRCTLDTQVQIGWLLRLSECIDEFYIESDKLPKGIFQTIYSRPNVALHDYKEVFYMKKNLKKYHCEDVSYIIDLYNAEKVPIIRENSTRSRRGIEKRAAVNQTVQKPSEVIPSTHIHNGFDTIAQAWKDGAYMFMIITDSVDGLNYSIDVTLSFEYKHGYLSANDWPFLPFYGTMCAIYSLYAIFWLVMSMCYWRDLLRIQLWVGGVILLGLMEKAAYLAEFDEINRSGYTFKVAMLVAEVISCFKRSLARMLVIIVSLGFGIVKPRLGPTMQKVIALGGLYFVFAVVDGVFRIVDRKEDTDSKGVLAGVPLVFIDVAICYWILTNLQQTMRTLRVRRNIPKLTLYRHFSNTLIFCVIASVAFMIWSLMRHRFVNCLKDWKELWLDDGFWHILFSFILLVIIILWRPSNNSQRFAFTPLLDNDEDDLDEEQETEVFDSLKMRSTKISTTKVKDANQKSTLEDDLKWVEENVPATLTEAALPGLVDSEEEIMTTRLEMSKMD